MVRVRGRCGIPSSRERAAAGGAPSRTAFPDHCHDEYKYHLKEYTLHSSTQIQVDNMSPPVLKCINRDHRENQGYKSFKEWLEQYNHVYIGPSLYKYVKNFGGKESVWVNPYQAHFPRDTANDLFEKFVRSNESLMSQLDYLENKVLGCWCDSNCHGEVLIKLYHERKNEVEMKQ